MPASSSVEVSIEDVNPEALFTESVIALSDLLSDAAGGTAVTHVVELRGKDLRALLAAWIDELLKLTDRDGFVPERVEKLRLGPNVLTARVAGERGFLAGVIRRLVHEAVELKRLEDGAWDLRIRLGA